MCENILTSLHTQKKRYFLLISKNYETVYFTVSYLTYSKLFKMYIENLNLYARQRKRSATSYIYLYIF